MCHPPLSTTPSSTFLHPLALISPPFFPWLDWGNGKMVFFFPPPPRSDVSINAAPSFPLFPPFFRLFITLALPLLSPWIHRGPALPSFQAHSSAYFFFLAPIFPPSSWAEIDNCLASLPLFFHVYNIFGESSCYLSPVLPPVPSAPSEPPAKATPTPMLVWVKGNILRVNHREQEFSLPLPPLGRRVRRRVRRGGGAVGAAAALDVVYQPPPIPLRLLLRSTNSLPKRGGGRGR